MGQELEDSMITSCSTKSTNREKEKHPGLETLVYVSWNSSALIPVHYILTQIYCVRFCGHKIEMWKAIWSYSKEKFISLSEVFQVPASSKHIKIDQLFTIWPISGSFCKSQPHCSFFSTPKCRDFNKMHNATKLTYNALLFLSRILFCIWLISFKSFLLEGLRLCFLLTSIHINSHSWSNCVFNTNDIRSYKTESFQVSERIWG